ncbi:MAG: hypothetical protein Q9162_004332 [Coniocarpon cinnabarinum]
MATRDFFDEQAGVDSEENDEDFDEDTGEARERKANGVNGDLDDSSEEDDDDDDEEAAQKVREGFIVDEEEEEDPAERRRRRKERKKRRREEREEEGLDEEDLDLIGELPDRRSGEPTFKRLKRGHRDERERERGVGDIFSDEDEELRPGPATSRNALAGEFDDFIEEDEPDEGEGGEEDHEVMVGRTRRGLDALKGLDAGLDEAAIEDMRAAFGDGTEYDWALDLQDDMDIGEVDPDKPVELKDVFEPSQLREKMLTEEDQLIRSTDIPERMQLAHKEFPDEDLDEQQWKARIAPEADWISSMLWPKKGLSRSLQGPFKKSVAHVLDFMNIGQKEVPYIFQHRKDYLIHAGSSSNGEVDEFEEQQRGAPSPEKLLNQSDLWEIFDLDLKYRSFLLKKQSLERLYESVKTVTGRSDSVLEGLLPNANLIEDVQDLLDYIQFQYAAEIKDLSVREPVNGQKRSRAVASIFERARAAPAYNVVSGFGITADSFAGIMLDDTQRAYIEDPDKRPIDMADSFVDGDSFPTGLQVFRAAKATFAEELAMNPRMRKLLRREYYMTGHFDCIRTPKGLKQIDEDNPAYEFKYLRHQNMSAMARRPELFLRMLKAEADGLVELRFGLGQKESLRKRLRESLESDNFSEIADAWNVERREVIDVALARLDKIIVKGVKESLKTECENVISSRCREKYLEKLDQAPYQPRGMDAGVVPRVLTLHNDAKNPRAGIVNAIWMEEDGRVTESKQFTLSELRLGSEEKALPDGEDVAGIVKMFEQHRPDIIGISGFSPETRSLYKNVQEIIAKFNIKSTQAVDDDDDLDRPDDNDKLLEVQIVNDEVARLYYTSERAQSEFPTLSAGSRYCVALARYLQSPIKEYAALGRDILSISFDPHQSLVPTTKLMKYLESAIIDIVNLTGVDLNEAVNDTYTANLLSYVCGLGPRKAAYMIQVINRQGGQVNTRLELIGNEEEGKAAAVTPTVFENCASFLFIKYDLTESGLNYLDNTRAHPDDYELANKMAADAMDLDEEDIQQEREEYGEYAVLRKMVKEGRENDVNSLELERYAEQIEEKMLQRKRATLETIRAELADPYEELRHEFTPPTYDEIFTMLTGETRDSICEGMVIPITIRKAFPDHVECKLDCGIDGAIPEGEYPSGVGASSGTDPRVAFKPHSTIQGKITALDRRRLTAQLSAREDTLRLPYKKDIERAPGEWDFTQEEADRREAAREKENVTGRPQRVIKHPLFRPFNSAQAEEFLGPQNRGDVVIRPSSNGMDHLAVTWKVSENVFQHIDVLELDKENEFSVGKTLKIAGRYTYSDLDELIAVHVKSMAKKVDEITADERFQRGSKTQAEQWLSAYMEANPKRSMYAFCINPQYPGYFYLCFKPSQQAKHQAWPIKVIPNAFELQKNPYPDMRALKNGFKTLFMKQQQQQAPRRY